MGDKNNPPGLLKTQGLRDLRVRLEKGIKDYQTLIELAVEREGIKSTNIFGKFLSKVERFLDGGSPQVTAKQKYSLEIAKNKTIIEAIDKGDVEVAIAYLIDEIQQAIHLANIGLFITGDRATERIWIKSAQGDINLLRKISPDKAERLQTELDKKTGSPLAKL